MTLPALATSEDVEALIGRAIAADDASRVTLLLRMASAAARRATGQTITAVAGDTFELEAGWGTDLWLPQRPVTAVTAVTIAGVAVSSTTYTINASGRLRRVAGWGGAGGVVAGLYDHGWDDTPEDLSAFVAGLVATRYAAQLGDEIDRVSQQQIGSWSEGYARAVSAPEPAITLSADQTKWLKDNYGIPAHSSTVQRDAPSGLDTVPTWPSQTC